MTFTVFCSISSLNIIAENGTGDIQTQCRRIMVSVSVSVRPNLSSKKISALSDIYSDVDLSSPSHSSHKHSSSPDFFWKHIPSHHHHHHHPCFWFVSFHPHTPSHTCTWIELVLLQSRDNTPQWGLRCNSFSSVYKFRILVICVRYSFELCHLMFCITEFCFWPYY